MGNNKKYYIYGFEVICIPAVYWYCALALIGAGVTTFIMITKKNYSEFITFFLFAMATAFIAELMVLFFLNSYAYKPGIYTDNYAENIFGHIILNATLWPAAALLVVAYSLRYRWMLSISVAFTLLDILFQNLGIYEHHWWRTWMTSAAILIYCVLMKLWYTWLKNKRSRVLRYITFWFVLWVILQIPISSLLLLGVQHTYVGWYENVYRDSGVFSVLFNAAASFVCAFLICILKEWYWKLAAFVIYFAGDTILLFSGVIFFSSGWGIVPLMLVRAFSLIAFIILENRYPYKPLKRRPLSR